jgi:hypothetical protein
MPPYSRFPLATRNLACSPTSRVRAGRDRQAARRERPFKPGRARDRSRNHPQPPRNGRGSFIGRFFAGRVSPRRPIANCKAPDAEPDPAHFRETFDTRESGRDYACGGTEPRAPMEKEQHLSHRAVETGMETYESLHMGFFSNLFKGTPRPKPVERVPALASLAEACKADPRSMWPDFSASLRGKWDLRIDAIAAINDLYILRQPTAQRQSLVDGLIASDPDNWSIVRATYYMKLAFDARRSGTKVHDEATFRRCVEAAMSDVHTALRLDSNDPAPCVVAMTLGRMSDNPELCAEMHDEALRRAPDCYAVHREYNDELSARWGGSHRAQLDHARKIAAGSLEGSLGAGLPINALYFNLSHFVQFDENQKGMLAFAQRSDVLQEVRAVAARSVTHPGHAVTAATFDLITKSCLLVMSGGDVDFVRQLFPLLGDVFIDNPWRQLNPDPEPMFDMYRKMYGKG